MPNNWSPGNYETMKEFYEALWDNLETPFL